LILVDTSVWVQHLRSTDAALVVALNRGEVLIHPFVIGELAMGNLRDRSGLVENLRGLPNVRSANDDEVMTFVEREKLYGRGLGYIDAHLLASVRLTPGARLWSRDRRLTVAAAALEVSAGLA
jgi:predicted nucleic acid-binding protein